MERFSGKIRTVTFTVPQKFSIVSEKGEFQCEQKNKLYLLPGDMVKFNGIKTDSGVIVSGNLWVSIPKDADAVRYSIDKSTRMGPQSLFDPVTLNDIYERLLAALRIHKASLKDQNHIIIAEGSNEFCMKKQTSIDLCIFFDDLAYNYYKSGGSSEYVSFFNNILEVPDALKFLTWWYRHRIYRQISLLLDAKYDENEVENCLRDANCNPMELFMRILTNPYCVPNIPMSAADCFASLNELELPESYRTCGEFVRALYKNMKDKQATCTSFSSLSHKGLKNVLDRHYKLLESEFFVVVDSENSAVYLHYAYEVETHVSKYLAEKIIQSAHAIANSHKFLCEKDSPPTRVIFKIPEEVLKGDPMIPEYVAKLNSLEYGCKTLDEEQKFAIQGCLRNNFTNITGGPGTGKSTITKEICMILEKAGIDYAFGAFTGKAVSRINDILKKDKAMTLDKMIYSKTPMSFQVLIIDEMSMVTTELFYRFIRKYPHSYKIIFIGDINQLPPIGWGHLFWNVIQNVYVPTYRLLTNHRVIGRDSLILKNLSGMVDPMRFEDEIPIPYDFETGPSFDVTYGDINDVSLIVKDMYAQEVALDDIVVISPYRDHIMKLNQFIQKIYFSEKQVTAIMDVQGNLWCVGDRVMMLKNNYMINVMNGEEGEVIEVTDVGVRVRFKNSSDGLEPVFRYEDCDHRLRQANYDRTDILLTNMLKHSFSVTVHKIQGSEKNYVIVFIPKKYTSWGTVSPFLNMNLLYTALSRGREAVFLVGDEACIRQATVTKAPVSFDKFHIRLIKHLKNNPDLEAVRELIIAQIEKMVSKTQKVEEEEVDEQKAAEEAACENYDFDDDE